jgi:hypothetical protein
MIDYRRTNVAIEAFYLLIPLFVSMIVMILMACHYGIGAGYWPTGFIATMVNKEIPFQFMPSDIFGLQNDFSPLLHILLLVIIRSS